MDDDGYPYVDENLTTIMYDRLIHIGNQAPYGANISTPLRNLIVTYTRSEEGSGVVLNHPIIIDLVDQFNQTVTTIPPQVVNINVREIGDWEDVLVSGSTASGTENGTANFSDIVVTHEPTGGATLEFVVFYENRPFETSLRIGFRDCVPGEINTGTICFECELGTFSWDIEDTQCNLCPHGATCNGGMNMDLSSGYWRQDESSTVLPCLIKEACLGGDDVYGQCKDGHEGHYCSVCSNNYYQSSATGMCAKCNNWIQESANILIVCFFVIILVVGCTCYKKRKWLLMKAEELSDMVAEQLEKFDAASFRTKLKILTAFFQIVTQLPQVLSLHFPDLFSEFLDYFWFVNLDFMNLFSLDCFFVQNFYYSLLVQTIAPFLLMAVVGFFLLCRLFVSYRMNPTRPSYKIEDMKQDITLSALVISFLVFASVSTIIFQTFQCDKFDFGSDRLVADYSVSCETDLHFGYEVYAGFMIIVYPIGIPFTYGYFLWKFKDRIDPPDQKVVCDDEAHLLSIDVLQDEKMKLRDEDEKIKFIGFLYENYLPRCWYFEVAECVRRLALAAIPVVIMRNSSTQIVITLIISLFFGAVYTDVKPFGTIGDNKTAIFTQWGITMTLIGALMVKIMQLTDDSEEQKVSENVIAGLLITIHVSVILMAFLSTIFAPNEDSVGDFREMVQDIKGDEEDENGEEEEEEKREDHTAHTNLLHNNPKEGVVMWSPLHDPSNRHLNVNQVENNDNSGKGVELT